MVGSNRGRRIVPGLLCFVLAAPACTSSGPEPEESPATEASPTVEAAPHWEYEGELGPENWASISPLYAACGDGKEQSPIDLAGAVQADLAPIEFDYSPSPLELHNNGHTIQATVESGSSITLDGTSYELVQFHFHLPSEHSVAGQPFAMEAHFVHRDAGGRLAVVGSVLKEGEENEALDEIWDELPAEEDGEVAISEPFPLDALYPAARTYYRYPGSLTTPDCREGVTWSVFTDSVSVSAAQAEVYRSIFPVSNRPVQPLNDRTLQVGGS